jgi:hypothetical protein
MKLKGLHIVFIVLLFAANALQAQVTLPSARPDRSEIRIGEQVIIDLSIEYRTSGEAPTIAFPQFKDTLVTGVELVESSEVLTNRPDSVNDPNLFKVQQQLVITSFDSGYYNIGPIPVVVNGQTMLSNSFALTVNTVAVDTTQMAIRDIKDIYDVKLTPMDYLKIYWWVALIVVLLIVAILLWMWYRKRQKNKPVVEVVPEEPVIPAHVLALKALDALQEKKLWQDGKNKLYHTELTDILREYIEQRFKVSAHEQTSDEILSGLQFSLNNPDALMRLRQVLKTADLVKFAKHKPGASENELSLTYAKDFVNLTVEITPTPKENEQ